MAGSDRADEMRTVVASQRFEDQLICFSDIDGTLVHYEDMLRLGDFIGPEESSNLTVWREKDSRKRHRVLRLPPSHTGSQGSISVDTLQLIAGIRARGVLFVLITGGRLTTLLQRLPFLPAADAYVCENGGRIFYPGSSTLPTACPLTEDLQWRAQHSAAAGPPSEQWAPPDERSGSLWEAFRSLKTGGWRPDATSYSTCFRLKLPPGGSDAELRQAAAALSSDLSTSYNLGCLDVYPRTSGKSKAGAYLLTHFRAPPENGLLLCDDDNDLGLASLVARVFLPGITSDSVAAAVNADPSKFVSSQRAGILATEEMLERVIEFVESRLGPLSA